MKLTEHQIDSVKDTIAAVGSGIGTGTLYGIVAWSEIGKVFILGLVGGLAGLAMRIAWHYIKGWLR